jgi:gamma-glutamyltranspeptidase / glutathione hydrolase
MYSRTTSTVLALTMGLVACAPEAPPSLSAQTSAPTATVEFPAGWEIPSSAVVPVRARHGMVATTDRVASEIGAEVLRRGGNAVDAAVAVHFALAVVNPEAGNIGGGGFMVLKMAGGTAATLDFRETAPAAATRDMFLDETGNLSDRSIVGHQAAGVPGSVAGMWDAHRRFGTLPWTELVQPAVHLAEGIVLHERLAQSLQRYETRFRRFPATEALFRPGGRAPRVGDRFAQPHLAETLRRIAADGRDGFYRGRTAELIVAEMRRGDGLISAEDLSRYQAVWREPIIFEYRGHSVVSMPPSSSGGATVGALLKILEGYDLRGTGWHSPEHVHLWTEATKRAFADRNAYLADPDFVPQPLPRMVSAEYGAERRAEVEPSRATPSSRVRPGLGPAIYPPAPPEGEHTTHYSIIDRAGNALGVTTTINSLYGSLVTVSGAGFLLNNVMDDFAARPGTPNQFGLVQGEANAVAPGKRMLSAMTPTILVDPTGRVRLVTGTPGGATIITTVAQILSNVVDFGMDLPTAMAAPRLHHQHLPDVLRYESNGLRPTTVERLRAAGHTVEERTGFQGDVQSVFVHPNGTLVGASDPRRGGAAVGVGEVREVVQ